MRCGLPVETSPEQEVYSTKMRARRGNEKRHEGENRVLLAGEIRPAIQRSTRKEGPSYFEREREREREGEEMKGPSV
jgi:hypothetical protein